MTLQLPPLCILSVNSILGRCVALIPIYNEDFHWHIFHTIGEIKTGNAWFHALFQFDLHSFDQNTLSFENSLFWNHRKIFNWKLNFSLFLFHFRAWFNLTCYHPPRATPGTSPALRARGWGIFWSGLVLGLGGWGWSKSRISPLWFCEVRVISRAVYTMAADLKITWFLWKNEGICRRVVGKELLIKI